MYPDWLAEDIHVTCIVVAYVQLPNKLVKPSCQLPTLHCVFLMYIRVISCAHCAVFNYTDGFLSCFAFRCTKMTIYFPREEISFPERAFKCVEN